VRRPIDDETTTVEAATTVVMEVTMTAAKEQ
jgi:hypothetical protein